MKHAHLLAALCAVGLAACGQDSPKTPPAKPAPKVEAPAATTAAAPATTDTTTPAPAAAAAPAPAATPAPAAAEPKKEETKK